MRLILAVIFLACLGQNAYAQLYNVYAPDGTYLGSKTLNPYDYNSIDNPAGPYGSPYGYNSIRNPYGRYGNPIAPKPLIRQDNPLGWQGVGSVGSVDW